MRSLLLLVFLFFGFLAAHAQQFQKIDFSVEGDILIVRYNLVKCPSQSFYDVKLKFIDKNGKTITPVTIEGDIKRVIPGEDKKIQWNYTMDVDNMEGDIKAILEIENSYTSRIVGGPGNVILSMIWPGLGDHFVNRTDKFSPYLIQILFAGAVGYGLYQKTQSDKFYAAYHAATVQNEMDTQYDQANSANQQFMISLAAAGAIWFFDVIHVISRGSKNVREQKKKNGLTYFESRPRLSFSTDQKYFQVMLTKKF